ncbi:DoxX family membrane protein [bacterium]|nr:DoxX family membrane protein [bacterium]
MSKMKIITNIARVLVGALFIFSGFIKANDPMGFGFKLEEYFEVFGTEFMVPIAMQLAIFICVFEILLGIMLLLGYLPKLVNRLLLAMIVFFTFLTFYSAYYNVVTDCGCFGDAIKLTPWQSFTKDVILLVLIVVLLWGEKHIKMIFSSQITKGLTIGATLASLLFPVYTYTYLPVIDFRPYNIGANIVEKMKTIRAPEVQMMFEYEKDGESYFFSGDELGTVEDLGSYNFVKREDKILDPGEPAPIHDFVLNDDNGNDVTNVFIDAEGYKLMTVQYDLKRTDLSKMEPMLALDKALEDKGVKCYHLTAGTQREIQGLNSPLKFYSVDKTTLKTIIRSNPGLVLFKGNVIVMKWPSTRFPEVDEVMAYVK